MSSRFLTAVLTAASVVLATHAYAETTINASKSNNLRPSIGVVSAPLPMSQSQPLKKTNVKGTKSNTSERMGGSGGVRGGGAPANTIRDGGSVGIGTVDPNRK